MDVANEIWVLMPCGHPMCDRCVRRYQGPGHAPAPVHARLAAEVERRRRWGDLTDSEDEVEDVTSDAEEDGGDEPVPGPPAGPPPAARPAPWLAPEPVPGLVSRFKGCGARFK
jgi:hypothetical protein